MAIEAYVGYPGEGKTFGITNRAYKDLKRGYKVFTSYPCKGCYKFTFDDLVNYTFPSGSTVIIDESGRWFNSRNWSKLPPAVFDLFTLHRHMKLDLIIAVQNFNRIDVALREVIQYVWWARNYWFLPWFMYELYYEVESLGLKQEVQKRMFVWKWSRSRRLYDTHLMAKEINKDEIPLVKWGEENYDGSLSINLDYPFNHLDVISERDEENTFDYQVYDPAAYTEVLPEFRRLELHSAAVSTNWKDRIRSYRSAFSKILKKKIG